MKTSFTMGPWIAQGYGPLKPIHIRGGKSGILIAEIIQCGPVACDEELANAHLIASAQELYEALDLVVDVYGATLTPERLEKFNDLLSRARGEA